MSEQAHIASKTLFADSGLNGNAKESEREYFDARAHHQRNLATMVVVVVVVW